MCQHDCTDIHQIIHKITSSEKKFRRNIESSSEVWLVAGSHLHPRTATSTSGHLETLGDLSTGHTPGTWPGFLAGEHSGLLLERKSLSVESRETGDLTHLNLSSASPTTNGAGTLGGS